MSQVKSLHAATKDPGMPGSNIPGAAMKTQSRYKVNSNKKALDKNRYLQVNTDMTISPVTQMQQMQNKACDLGIEDKFASL